ncbi:NAD(P)-dependent alcohol dehydrogenase [Steroidobacter sp.]|uniref:NAD(P)-dependent alcohol dehydrogenase n=1 Tax=Steroidobacter sp. TaxID=1978227 RepID=UPI001A5BB7DB|nr:NAD(P)-dependent alcohol dehydrogenase [Steroidobacter sp.]MBL8268061.1 NAD(P)-dependent alcohol dehydrogenase [Steroidobacter sp.]
MTTIRAAVFEPNSQHAALQDLSLRELRDDEVLVRLTATGVCHTDLGFRCRVPHALVLGHEGAGKIERVGAAVRSVGVGDSVVMSFNSCHECPSCLAGKPSYCHKFMPLNFTGLRLDGSSALAAGDRPIGGHFFGQSSFATHSVAHESSVVKVRADAPLELLGPLGCGVQTGAGAVMNVLRPRAGESIVIVGAGGVGMSGLMAAVVEGCSPIIVLEPNAERRALAKELGAHRVIDPLNEDVAAIVREVAPAGVLHALDTSGLPKVVAQVLGLLALRGSIALVTATPREAVLEVPMISAIGRGISIRGVIEGDAQPQEFIPKLVELVMSGRFPLHKLVRFYDLENIEHALEDQESGKVIKPIVRMR